MKKKFLVPNFFTGLNFTLGVISILITAHYFRGEELITWTQKPPLVLAAWFIIWSVSLDKLDGLTARLMKASSDFGSQFDSLADLITFGIAPAVLCYCYLYSLDTIWFEDHTPFVVVSVIIYTLCTAARLARFNSIDSGSLKLYFKGMASPVAGGLIALLIILFEKYSLESVHDYFIYIIPISLILLGLLMISNFYSPKLLRRKNKWINLIQAITVNIGYVCCLAMIFPEFLISILLIYVMIGFSFCYINKNKINFYSE